MPAQRISTVGGTFPSPERAAHSDGGARGLPVSLRGLFQNQLVQREVGDSPLETRILPLKLLEAASLIDLQPTIFLAPAVIALLLYANLPTNLADRSTLRQ